MKTNKDLIERQAAHKWETCFECPLSHGCPKIKGCTNEQAIEYASQIPNDCPLSAQSEQKTDGDTISRQAAIDMCRKPHMRNADCSDFEMEIMMLPSAQPEIIRCKDCLHWVRTCGDNQWGLGDCDVFDKHLVMCEGYCAWAERRTNGSD